MLALFALAALAYEAFFVSSDTPGTRLVRGDREVRKQAAWAMADSGERGWARALAERLAPDAEPDPDVREAVVYALGRLADPNSAAAIAEAVLHDPSGYVRQAAWLALARADAERFRTLAQHDDATHTALSTTTEFAARQWVQLGIAQGRMDLGEFHDWPRLLGLAMDAPDDVRLLARRAVVRYLAPLLEVSGRWPLAVNAGTPEAWSDAGLALIFERCQNRDLAAVFSQTRPFFERSVPLRYNLGKLLKTRQRVAQVLFGP